MKTALTRTRRTKNFCKREIFFAREGEILSSIGLGCRTKYNEAAALQLIRIEIEICWKASNENWKFSLRRILDVSKRHMTLGGNEEKTIFQKREIEKCEAQFYSLPGLF